MKSIFLVLAFPLIVSSERLNGFESLCFYSEPRDAASSLKVGGAIRTEISIPINAARNFDIKKILKNAAKIVVSNNYRLNCRVNTDASTEPFASTLADLPLDLTFYRQPHERTIKELQKAYDNEINGHLDSDGLGWKITFIHSGSTLDESRKKRVFAVDVILLMQHYLADGMSVISVGRQLMEAVDYLIENPKYSIDEDMEISAAAPPAFEKHIKTPYYTWPFYLGSATGLWYNTPMGSYAKDTWIGHVPPEGLQQNYEESVRKSNTHHQIKRNMPYKTTRSIIVEIPSNVVADLRKKSRTQKASITSTILTAALGSYRSVLQTIQKEIQDCSQCGVAFNMRHMTTPRISPYVIGNYVMILFNLKCCITDQDDFWALSRHHKQSIARFTGITSLQQAYIGHSLAGKTLAEWKYKNTDPLAERPVAVIVSNLGSLGDDPIESKWTKIIDLFGSSNSYHRGAIQQYVLTCVTYRGKMNVLITSPHGRVLDDEAELFAKVFKRSLFKLTTMGERDLNVGKVRAETV